MLRLGGFTKKASVVFYLSDAFNGKGVSTASITVDNLMAPFVNKRDGYYVFSNLTPGNFIFNIREPNYTSISKELAITEDGTAVIQIAMQHDVHSRLIENTTRIKFLLTDAAQQPINNEFVEVAVISSRAYGRLTEDVEKDSESVKFYSKEGPLLEGKHLFLHGPDSNESISIKAYQRESDSYQLFNGLFNRYLCGTPLYPLWKLKTNVKGEFILPLAPDIYGENKSVEIKIWYGGQESSRKLELLAGKINQVNVLF